MVDCHLAQINIALARSEMTGDIMSGFVARLDEINALADISPGFIWRLQSDEGDATTIRVFDDPLLLINMSVWADIESLKNYVYRSAHVELIKDRDAWFKKCLFHIKLYGGCQKTIFRPWKKARKNSIYLREKGRQRSPSRFLSLIVSRNSVVNLLIGEKKHSGN